VDEAERAKIHIAKMALDAARADFTEAEKQRRIDEAARDLARSKPRRRLRSMRGSGGAGADECRKAPYQKPVEYFEEPIA